MKHPNSKRDAVLIALFLVVGFAVVCLLFACLRGDFS